MPNKKSIIKRKPQKEAQPKMRTNHLLIIGIDQYANGISPLNNAVRDAQQFKKLVIEQFQFTKEHITELYNEEATRSNILATFGKLLHQLTDNDNLIFYYSGHGEQVKVGNGTRGYWIPSDAKNNESWTYIPNSEIINLFKLSKAHHIFGIVDSCFSGSLFATRKLTTAVERVDSFPSRWLLTAGRLEVVSDGTLGTNSPFATSLFTYLKNTKEDGIWVADLCSWVLKGMSFNTEKQTPRGEPLQDVGHYGGQFVFYRKGYQPPILEQDNISETAPSKIKGINLDEGNQDETTIEEPNESASVSDMPLIINNFSDLQNYLLDLLITDLKKALDSFRTISKDDDSGIIQQLARYNSNTRDFSDGIITVEQRNRTNAQITNALKYMIQKLEEKEIHSDYLSKLGLDQKVDHLSSADTFPTDIQALEKSGLEAQAKLLMEKLNYIKSARIKETDASRQFAYDQEIADLEKELEKIKAQIRE